MLKVSMFDEFFNGEGHLEKVTSLTKLNCFYSLFLSIDGYANIPIFFKMHIPGGEVSHIFVFEMKLL